MDMEEIKPTQMTEEEKEPKERFDKLKELADTLANKTIKEINSMSDDKMKADCVSRSLMYFMLASMRVML